MSEPRILHSVELNEDRQLEIFLPSGYHDTFYASVHYPVVYVLDGETYGQLAACLITTMGQSGNTPEAIVVAITSGLSRMRDFTPTCSQRDWQGKKNDILDSSGGGDRFLAFVEKELTPYINARYRTVEHRTLVGHSLGGLIALHSFLTQPGLFQGYLAIDASLWWDNQLLASRIEALNAAEDVAANSATQNAAQHKTQKAKQKTTQKITSLKGHIYCSLADHESSGPNNHSTMIQGNKRFVESLKQRTKATQNSSTSSLMITFEPFVDETHASVVAPSLHNGLKAIFKGHRLPYGWAPDVNTVIKHFEAFAQRLGFDYTAPEKLVEYLAWQAAQLFGDQAALAFKQLNVSNYPSSSQALAQLAETYVNLGDTGRAKHYYEKSRLLNKDNPLAQQRAALDRH